ncbi:hypothetical protein [Nocardia brevicatena]|uniref:hypothetical protein n=1 Tax=Nocardia brevicatena TaxID=37327 RepID=UPI00031D4410|nr:hypothetical protein [Nocardia brevicatena]
MSFPELPRSEPGEVLLVCTCYEDGIALWGGLLDEIGGRREGDVLVVGDSGVRLRPVEDCILEIHGDESRRPTPVH